ncbi:unnamed protein product [[Actinomadura] parvosata subsp. kistnae]|nr:unnamed protein product [Actinomadura parvosata subsp. kistnae]
MIGGQAGTTVRRRRRIRSRSTSAVEVLGGDDLSYRAASRRS